MSDCGHDGWQAGCPWCEAQERAALEAMGERFIPLADVPDLEPVDLDEGDR